MQHKKLSPQARKLIDYIPIFCHQSPHAAMEVFKDVTLALSGDVRRTMLANELTWMYENELSYLLDNGYIELLLANEEIGKRLCMDYPYTVLDYYNDTGDKSILKILTTHNPHFIVQIRLY